MMEENDQSGDLELDQDGSNSIEVLEESIPAAKAREEVTESLEVEEIIEAVGPLGLEDIRGLWIDVRDDLRNYYDEALKQSNRSFVFAAFASIAGLVFFLFALGFIVVGVLAGLEFGSIAVSALIPALAGGLLEVISGLNFWLYSKASNQLAMFRSRMETTLEFMMANIMVSQIEGSQENRDALFEQVIKTVLEVSKQHPVTSSISNDT